MSYLTIVLISVAVLVLLYVIGGYVKAPPSQAYIISGIRKEPKVLIGKGGFRLIGLERLDKVFLGQVTVDVKTNRSVPTNDFINVNVDAVAKVRVIPTAEGIRLAAKNFLNMTATEVANQIQDSLEGNMREVVGALSLKVINLDRDKFSDQIANKAAPDMNKLGLEIISCNIQNITDDNGLIKDLGADNTFSIKKTAAITKAQAERDIAKAESEAKQEANDARVEAETQIAIKNNQLAIKKSELAIVEKTKQADADAAYAIQQQRQQKVINVETVEAASAKSILEQEKLKEINSKAVEAETEKARRQQELTQEQIKIEQNKLEALVNKKADADKYQIEVNAQAKLEQEKRDAEARAYKAEQDAKAQVSLAEAKKKEMVLQAEGIKAIGEAEAYKIQKAGEAEAIAIEKKGIAEAEAMQKKAEAYEKYGQAAILDMVIKIMPEMAGKVADPISAIKDVRIYGSGNADGISQVSGNVPVVLQQAMDTISEATGVDVKEIIKANTLEGKIRKDINIDGKADVTSKK